MLSPRQTFLKLMMVWVVGLAILFGVTLILFDMSRGQVIVLGVVACIILIIGAIRTWKNPEVHR
jgi:uncharacterized membrane protein YhaH (DUF805 family)